MAPSDDLKSHAASSQDFYALLDISPAAADTEIRRAYRRTALKYHPDKIANPTPADIDRFHLLQIAYDVLSEPSVRQLYDNAREARERKKRENEMLQGVRRKMKEDLEAREKGGGLKRAWFPGGPGAEAVDREAEDKLEQEIRRLAEDGRRRRQAKEELMRREILEEEERREQEKEKEEKGSAEPSAKPTTSENGGGAGVLEIDRSVKVRWLREGAGLGFDKASLESLFSRFGKVESVFTLKDKRQRVGDKREKKTVATGVVVFSSIVGTHAAVEDSKRQQGREWDVIQSVYWASGQEPEWASHRPSPPMTATPSTPEAATKRRNLNQFPGLDSRPSDSDNGRETKKAPSFASFGKGNVGANSPSLEEITMIRLKNAERNKLKQDIQKEDEANLAGESVS
jgi:DnaJ family protein C protein 17